jgi:hypothetical protein
VYSARAGSAQLAQQLGYGTRQFSQYGIILCTRTCDYVVPGQHLKRLFLVVVENVPVGLVGISAIPGRHLAGR